MSLYAQVTYLDATTGCLIEEEPVHETFASERGELYRYCQRAFGRCTGKVYVDGELGIPRAVGWVFQGRDHYQDSCESYLREVWVTVHASPPTSTIQYHYADASS